MCHNTICAELVREAPKKLFGVQGFPETSVAEFWGFTGLFFKKEHILPLSLFPIVELSLLFYISF